MRPRPFSPHLACCRWRRDELERSETNSSTKLFQHLHPDYRQILERTTRAPVSEHYQWMAHLGLRTFNYSLYTPSEVPSSETTLSPTHTRPVISNSRVKALTTYFSSRVSWKSSIPKWRVFDVLQTRRCARSKHQPATGGIEAVDFGQDRPVSSA